MMKNKSRKIHVVKTLSNFFIQAIEGIKPFEIRKNDRDYKTNDLLIQQEIIIKPHTNEYYFTGRNILSKIINVIDYPQGLQQQYVVLALEHIYLKELVEVNENGETAEHFQEL